MDKLYILLHFFWFSKKALITEQTYRDKYPFTFTAIGNLEDTTQPNEDDLEGGRNLEYLEKSHTGTGKVFKVTQKDILVDDWWILN